MIEYRYQQGNQDRAPGLVAELTQLKVDVLVLATSPAIRAAKQAAKRIPVVMVTTSDPVRTGLIDTLARPGGHITGLTRLSRDLNGKRLELLKETVPTISSVGVLLEANSTSGHVHLKEYETAAHALQIRLQSLEIRRQGPDFELAFRNAKRDRISAIVTISNAFTILYKTQITEFSIWNRMPSMYEVSDHVEEGGPMSYAASDLRVLGAPQST